MIRFFLNICLLDSLSLWCLNDSSVVKFERNTLINDAFGATLTSEFKVLYKLLRTDDASDFDDLGYTNFNTDGSPDEIVPASADESDFREYVYTAGVTDDGIGNPLDEFISFQIKIVMQGTNSAEPPRIKEFRTLALVT